MIPLLLFLAQLAAPQALTLTIDPPPLVVSVSSTLISMNAFQFGPDLPSEAYAVVSLGSLPSDTGVIQVGLDEDGNPACAYTGTLDVTDDFELSGFSSPCGAGTLSHPLANVAVSAGVFGAQ